MENKSYRQIINEWRQERDEIIRKENGWLALVGLYWLKIGKNKLGSDPQCEVQLPERAPANIGYLDFNGKSVSLHVAPNQTVRVNGEETNFLVMQTDEAETPSFINLLDIQIVVIQRGRRFGARIWDNQSEERRDAPPRIWYDIDESFRIPAVYSPYDRPKTAYFPDVSGEKSEFPVEGYLEFEFDGKGYQLDVNKEDSGAFFIRFWDPTSRDETYPTGRYLIADQEENGAIFIDFNKAFCPPCAFTNFATCVFAPEQNRLDFKVTAGEMYRRH
ncbi:MAG: DUF1684 domain-containing protein [Anaerolineales bacterium]|nr:DUF1684 domain-containing protein [Anaerolineales bacterium]